MEIHTTEEQQVEAIKKWWRDNMWSVIGGVAIGISVLVGSRAWIDNKNTFAEAASAEYLIMMEQLSQGQNEAAADHGAKLLGQFADTPYASLAALTMAKVKLEGGDAIAASSHLRWALDNTQQGAVKHEARLRLAQLLLADGKNSEALNMLNGVEAGAYTAAYNRLKGDAYVADGQIALARTAYTLALEEIASTGQGRQLLQMKLDDLGQTAGPS